MRNVFLREIESWALHELFADGRISAISSDYKIRVGLYDLSALHTARFRCHGLIKFKGYKVLNDIYFWNVMVPCSTSADTNLWLKLSRTFGHFSAAEKTNG